MALTAAGAWYPVLPEDPPFSISGWGELRSGEGPPPVGLGNLGDVYVDTTNNVFYLYGAGGWEIAGGGGGGLVGDGSPEGVVSADPGQLYWDSTNNNFWVKDTGVDTNTGWYQMLGG